ncbi:MAG: glycosyl transferase family A [Gammaproteobacteria bacterium]|nr:MAG: glycosyl transferase family A [Gammaproteobacteria bacterium]
MVSFIIPHKGREKFLISTLESILSQNYDHAQYEIILVTQNEAVDLNSDLNKSSIIKVFKQPESKTISELRNFGVAQSQGEYLAFLDADIKLKNNWLSCMLSTLSAQPTCLLVSAMQINGENPPQLEQIRTALSNAEIDCDVNFLPGRNLFLAKSIFEKVGGFPVHLVTCEDYFFTDQVSKLGSLYYTSDSAYVHLGEDKKHSEMFKKEIWRGQSNLQSIKGRTIPLREIPSFIIPVVIAFLFVIAIFALLMGNVAVALSTTILLSIPVMIYSLRLYLLANSKISFGAILKFYLIYFPARAFGTLGGLFKSISTSSHK